jgi:hypothetical protein
VRQVGAAQCASRIFAAPAGPTSIEAVCWATRPPRSQLFDFQWLARPAAGSLFLQVMFSGPRGKKPRPRESGPKGQCNEDRTKPAAILTSKRASRSPQNRRQSARRCRFRRSSLDSRTSITNANTPRIASAAVVIIAANDHWRQVRLAHIVRR